MTRMTDAQRTAWATHPDRIPVDTQCDRCDRPSVARGTDGHQADAFCADHAMEHLNECRAARLTRDQYIANVNAAIGL
jgi:hypothetical protein